MKREDIITEVRLLLDETVDGYWTEAELWKYGREVERDLIKHLPTQHINNLLHRKIITADAGVGPLCYAGMSEGKLFIMEDDFLRFSGITDKISYKFATLIEFEKLYFYQDNPRATPNRTNPICFFCAEGTPSISGLALVPCPTNTADVYYYRDCIEWVDGNKDSDPEIGDSGHQLLIDGICAKALEKDHEEMMLKFEKNYKDGILSLGGK